MKQTYFLGRYEQSKYRFLGDVKLANRVFSVLLVPDRCQDHQRFCFSSSHIQQRSCIEFQNLAEFLFNSVKGIYISYTIYHTWTLTVSHPLQVCFADKKELFKGLPFTNQGAFYAAGAPLATTGSGSNRLFILRGGSGKLQLQTEWKSRLESYQTFSLTFDRYYTMHGRQDSRFIQAICAVMFEMSK